MPSRTPGGPRFGHPVSLKFNQPDLELRKETDRSIVMPAVLVALYDSHATAVRVRTQLVHEGFPTDRVDLASPGEPGPAGMIAAGSASDQFREYFESLFDDEHDRRHAQCLADRVRGGAAAITVHPRGQTEIERAIAILAHHRPLEIEREHLDDTTLEKAASDHERSYLSRVLTGERPDDSRSSH